MFETSTVIDEKINYSKSKFEFKLDHHFYMFFIEVLLLNKLNNFRVCDITILVIEFLYYNFCHFKRIFICHFWRFKCIFLGFFFYIKSTTL